MKKLNQRQKTVILTVIMAVLLTAIYVCGALIPDEAVNGSFLDAGQSPSFAHPFGTDTLGRDLLLRTVKGLSVSMTVGLAASVISGVIAVLTGAAAASGSRLADSFIGWLIDLVMSVPHTILVMLISFAMGRELKGLLIGIAATHWCSLARVIRGEVLQLRDRHYIAVSRKLGRSSAWILAHHLLPHLTPQFLVGLILMFPHAVLHEATVSFLGFGLSPEQPAIGIILSESMRYLTAGMWWSAVLPGLTLVLIVLLIDKLGDCLKMIIDPYTVQE
ncbi:MAG: ABC transporter permease [Oscillospiraceae bacterium]|nr:ABC transporter permease [Oscillospiraceae bacterium]